MLGQKIIESYADFENDNASYLLPEPSTGLTIRRIKSAGLRIVTESETLSSENAFRVRAAIVALNPFFLTAYRTIQTPYAHPRPIIVFHICPYERLTRATPSVFPTPACSQ